MCSSSSNNKNSRESDWHHHHRQPTKALWKTRISRSRGLDLALPSQAISTLGQASISSLSAGKVVPLDERVSFCGHFEPVAHPSTERCDTSKTSNGHMYVWYFVQVSPGPPPPVRCCWALLCMGLGFMAQAISMPATTMRVRMFASSDISRVPHLYEAWTAVVTTGSIVHALHPTPLLVFIHKKSMIIYGIYSSSKTLGHRRLPMQYS